ncbi:hypothetical protein ACFSR7_12525 [Cohnella sp. GCM10020058]|uniref:hypothetical protein n=1 Tax=Cohnella sp. GCM10020058 TaxID=3317330 RepID=UPI00362EEC3A
MDPKIVQLDVIRIERHKPRKCTCDPEERSFTVDNVNREITCGCGMTVEPFEAMNFLAERYDRINRQHVAMDEQRRSWAKQKPHSILFKRLEQNYRRGEMLPTCPHCEVPIDPNKLTFWVNAKFYLQRQKQIKAALVEEAPQS